MAMPFVQRVRAAAADPFARGTWLLALIFVISLPAVTPRLYAADEIEYFAFLRSAWFDHDLSFDNEYRYFYDHGIARAYGFHETFLEATTPTGHRVNFGTVGAAILWAPFYAVGDVAARGLHAAGASVAVDGYSKPYLTAIAVGSATLGFAALLLSVSVARRLVGSGLIAGIAIWVGTPLLFYMYLAPGMSHAASAFAVALFVWTWLRVRNRWSAGGLIALGVVAALMAMVREQDAFFIVGPAADAMKSMSRPRPGQPAPLVLTGRVLAGAVIAALCYVPQAVAYVVINGRLGPSPLVSAKMFWSSPHALQVLLSPAHGFIPWTPLVALSLAGLIVLMTRPPRGSGQDVSWVAACLMLMVVGQIYISGAVDTWTVAGAFGQRRFVGTTIVLVVGLAGLLESARTRAMRAAAGVALCLAIWWNLGLMVQFGTGTMDRQRLQLAENAYRSFVTVPRELPGLAYRYLFDRASFYQHQP